MLNFWTAAILNTREILRHCCLIEVQRKKNTFQYFPSFYPSHYSPLACFEVNSWLNEKSNLYCSREKKQCYISQNLKRILICKGSFFCRVFRNFLMAGMEYFQRISFLLFGSKQKEGLAASKNLFEREIEIRLATVTEKISLISDACFKTSPQRISLNRAISMTNASISQGKLVSNQQSILFLTLFCGNLSKISFYWITCMWAKILQCNRINPRIKCLISFTSLFIENYNIAMMSINSFNEQKY